MAGGGAALRGTPFRSRPRPPDRRASTSRPPTRPDPCDVRSFTAEAARSHDDRPSRSAGSGRVGRWDQPSPLGRVGPIPRSAPADHRMVDHETAQPMAWLNWPQIAVGCQSSGSPRISRGACQASVQPSAARAGRDPRRCPAERARPGPGRRSVLEPAGVEDRKASSVSGAIVRRRPTAAGPRNRASVPDASTRHREDVRAGERPSRPRPVLARRRCDPGRPSPDRSSDTNGRMRGSGDPASGRETRAPRRSCTTTAR